MRTSLMLAVVVMVLGCDRGQRAELERQNAELQGEKAALEKTLAETRAELEKLRAAQAAQAAPPTLQATPPTGDEAILQAAQDAYVHGEYLRAIQLAKKTVATSPSQAWRIVGASNCFLKDRAGAKDAYDHLGDKERPFLKYVCHRNDVKLD